PGDVAAVPLVPLRDADAQPGFGLPDAGGGVEAPGRRQVVAVRRPGEAVHIGVVPDEGPLKVPGVRVPEADDPVVSAGGQVFAVRADGENGRVPPVPLGLDGPGPHALERPWLLNRRADAERVAGLRK